MQKTKINGPSGPVDALELKFNVTDNPWVTIKLEDDTVLHARIMIMKVFRLEQYDPTTGEPAYVFTSKNDFTTDVPLKLKKFTTYPARDDRDVT